MTLPATGGFDAGATDAGTTDAAADAGATEGGTSDAGPLDAGMPDAGQCARDTTDLPGDGLDSNCDGVDGDRTIGVFVAPTGNDTADGTPEAPLATIAAGIDRAIMQLGRKEVIIASGTYTLAETLEVPGGVGLFGGYDPSTWELAEASQLDGPATAILINQATAPVTLSRQRTRVGWGRAPTPSGSLGPTRR